MKVTFLCFSVIIFFFSCDFEKKADLSSPPVRMEFAPNFRALNFPYSMQADSAFNLYDYTRFNNLPFYIRDIYKIDDSLLNVYGFRMDTQSVDFTQSVYSFGKLQLADSAVALIYASVFFPKENEIGSDRSVSSGIPQFVVFRMNTYDARNKRLSQVELGRVVNSPEGILAHAVVSRNEIKFWEKEEAKEEIDSVLLHKKFSLMGLPATQIRTIRISKISDKGLMSSKELARDYDQVYFNSKNMSDSDFADSILNGKSIALSNSNNHSVLYSNARFAYDAEMARTWVLVKIDSIRYYLACTAPRVLREEKLLEVFALPNSDVNAICLVYQHTQNKGLVTTYEIYEYDAVNNPGRLVFREDISDWIKGIRGKESARKFILDKYSKRM